MRDAPDAIVIGGGLAGLAAACRLHDAGRSVLVLEAANAVGGRVRTDQVEGFRLDRGFQVLLTAYPEARALLDYPALDLRAFEPGALIRARGGWHTFGDPWRRPLSAFSTLVAAVGSLADKLRIARLRQQLVAEEPGDRYRRPETTTARYLEQLGFSRDIVDRFFRPFLAGIFLDPDLEASSRMFEFVFRMFSLGDGAIPARGMQAIPDQLAARLPAGSVRLRTRVTAIDGQTVRLESGEALTARAVVAAAGPATPTLAPASQPARAWRAVTCLYFAAPRAPEPAGRYLVLNGERAGPVNNLCVPSNLAPELALPGAALISATVLGTPAAADDELERAVREQLSQWYGVQAVHGWRRLATYRIREALPVQTPPWYTTPRWPVRIRPGLYAAGDTLDTASIDGAFTSGRLAADAVVADLT